MVHIMYFQVYNDIVVVRLHGLLKVAMKLIFMGRRHCVMLNHCHFSV